jgi:hypothetical protein
MMYDHYLTTHRFSPAILNNTKFDDESYCSMAKYDSSRLQQRIATLRSMSMTKGHDIDKFQMQMRGSKAFKEKPQHANIPGTDPFSTNGKPPEAQHLYPETERIRQRLSDIRGKALRENYSDNVQKHTKESHSKTIRQVATEKYEARKKEKGEINRIIQDLKKANPHPGKKKMLVPEKPLEQMATSTRRNSFDDREKDRENLELMKCQLIRDMEVEATSKALDLIDSFFDNRPLGYLIV